MKLNSQHVIRGVFRGSIIVAVITGVRALQLAGVVRYADDPYETTTQVFRNIHACAVATGVVVGMLTYFAFSPERRQERTPFELIWVIMYISLSTALGYEPAMQLARVGQKQIALDFWCTISFSFLFGEALVYLWRMFDRRWNYPQNPLKLPQWFA